MKTKFSYTILFSVLFIMIITSCANVGQPTGGDKDSIPPQVTEMIPSVKETNYQGKEFKVTFNEFVNMSELRQKMVISPPQKEMPNVKTRGKSFTIVFQDTMLQNTTYTLDFKDVIEDNNEGNKFNNFRTSFSTGPTIDTLRITGMVRDAFNLTPIEGATVFVYKDLSDSASIKQRPSFVAKTNKEGVFIVDGLGAETYRVYAASDLNRDYKLNNYSEPYAFYPTTITPSAKFVPEEEIMVRGLDTLRVSGTIYYSPQPILLSQFQEKVLLQSMNDYKRVDSTHFYIGFTESLDHNFNIEALNIETPMDKWLYSETSAENDSINYWITDPNIYSKDTILLAVTYTVPDSLYRPKIQTDTLELLKPKKRVVKRKRRKKIEDNENKVPVFNWSTNADQTIDPYTFVYIESKEPILGLSKEFIHLTTKEDTLDIPVDFTMGQDSLDIRKYYIDFDIEAGKSYRLLVDSAATKNIYQAVSNTLDLNINVQKEEYYGKIILSIQNVNGPTLVQLIKDNKEETIVNELSIEEDGEIEFFYVKPAKYLIKAIYDTNKNGQWDTGNLLEHLMPEGVVYYQEIMKIRSNWDNKKSWTLPDPLEFTKDIKDPDKIEKDVEKDQ
ncbi:Ig-like domain-containing protein [Halosquirtibacter xylanolyticus]|uniref:Ig-like domain-containing protein n=1 Tax=Halosquirtibacter xylanolyticus TaxID=3374599 RepID=UPI003748882F|nr:Ig-like domain-containing protein [Prolixibacteraceae bacterium]